MNLPSPVTTKEDPASAAITTIKLAPSTLLYGLLAGFAFAAGSVIGGVIGKHIVARTRRHLRRRA